MSEVQFRWLSKCSCYINWKRGQSIKWKSGQLDWKTI